MDSSMPKPSGNETNDRRTARERLLAAANELFYNEGIHTVGVDRVIERSGVAKATLYNVFGSKDELIRAYLNSRMEFLRDANAEALATRFHIPREQLLGLFDVQIELFAQAGFRGCAFINASSEAPPGTATQQTCDRYRAYLRSLFASLAEKAGAENPEQLAIQLMLLYDGVAVSVRMDGDARSARAARDAAAASLDVALRERVLT
jgi:AcrR family transcriptional regulator